MLKKDVPAAGLAVVHELSQPGKLALGGCAAIAHIPELRHPLCLRKDMQGPLPQLESACICIVSANLNFEQSP